MMDLIQLKMMDTLLHQSGETGKKFLLNTSRKGFKRAWMMAVNPYGMLSIKMQLAVWTSSMTMKTGVAAST